jgi:hypothetical protein
MSVAAASFLLVDGGQDARVVQGGTKERCKKKKQEGSGSSRSKERRKLVCHGKAQSVLFVGIRYLTGLFHPGMPGSPLFLQVGFFGAYSKA